MRAGLRVLFILVTIVEIILSVAVVLIAAYLLKIPLNKVSTYYLIGIMVIIIGGMTAWFVNYILLRPIKQLSKAMDAVASGDFEVQLETANRIREIKNIYEKFNLMTKELRSTEILQSDFVSNVSHEIKTPITSIEGYTMLLQGEQLPEEERKLFVEKILFNTRRLSELVGNILLLSKIDNQVIETGKKRFRLDEQIRQSLLMLEPKWERKELAFEVCLEEIWYEGNESLLMHVWNNLLDNAIKFSECGSTITLSLAQQEDGICYAIADEGPGIPEELQQKVFQRFYQADGSRGQEGNGLGLALVKRILTLCQGEISVENLPEKGCRFTVYLK